MTTTTAAQTLTTSTLCFRKESCAVRDPYSPPGLKPASDPKICAPGCRCVAITDVTCPEDCQFVDVDGTDDAEECPTGCVPGPDDEAIPDPCNSCTVNDPLADMVIPTCPAVRGKKKRAIEDSAMLPLGDLTISPTATYPATIERWETFLQN